MKEDRTLRYVKGSYEVSIPPLFVKNLGWLPGDPVEVEADEEKKVVIIKKKGVNRK